MPANPPPNGSPFSASQDGVPLDGVGLERQTKAAASPRKTKEAVPASVSRTERSLLFLFGIPYLLYAFWCGFLLLTLPDPQGRYPSLVSIGLLSALGGAALIILIGWFAVMRISASKVSIASRRRSLVKVVATLLPGLLLSAAVPVFITREPPVNIDVVSPAQAADFVAPVAVTFSVQNAVQTLARLDHRAVKFQWDTNGDGTQDDETLTPQETTVYPHQGVYSVVVRIVFSDNSYRRLVRAISIPQEVFSVMPYNPTVDKPARFSIAALLADPKQLKQVTWDFGDNSTPQTSTSPDVVHTFYALGTYPVAATVQLQNQSLAVLKRTVQVQNEPPLPFPITLTTEPKDLVGPAPFGVVFHLDTKEPLKNIHWSFGDGKEQQGPDLQRIGHTYDHEGIFSVDVQARSASGDLADLNALVRVAGALSLPDLQFVSTPPIQAQKIEGEAPLTVTVTPQTAVPLIQFSWDAPQARNVQTDQTGKITAEYPDEGTYTLTLIAQDADGKTLRLPLTVTVDPPAAQPVILMQPDGGSAPLTVTFDASQSFAPPNDTIAGFKWLFGDEGQGQNAVQLGAARIDHVYQQPGQYTVTLTVVMASGKEYTAQKTIVVQKPALHACFLASRTKVQAGNGVQFDSSCTTGAPTSYLWDVRNSAHPETVLAQSPDKNYVYVFSGSGTYTVNLTLQDQWKNEDSQSVTITVTP